MARIVIDANVIISAAFGGKPLEAVLRAFRGHEVYVSDSIARELETTFLKLGKKILSEIIPIIQDKIHRLRALARHVQVSANVALSRDPEDDHYLFLCKEVKADFLATGDKDLLSLPPEPIQKQGIPCQIATPDLFLEIIS
jgi:putative PIN family toxin of toxin-antitoxin system